MIVRIFGSARPLMRLRVLVVGAAGAGVDLARDDAVAGVDVRGARHAGIEAANRAQDIHSLEVFRIFESLQQRRVQDRFFIRTRVIPWIARRCVDRGGRDDLIVGHVSVLKLEMMSEPAAARAPEANSDLITFLRNFERSRNFGFALLQEVEALEPIVHRDCRIEGDAIGARPIPLERVPDRRDLPFDLTLRKRTLRQHHFQACASRFYERIRTDFLRGRRGPKTSIATGFSRLPIPAGSTRPGIFFLPILPGWLRLGFLIPWMIWAERIA